MSTGTTTASTPMNTNGCLMASSVSTSSSSTSTMSPSPVPVPPESSSSTSLLSFSSPTKMNDDRLPSYLQKKAEEINLLLLEPQVDLWKIRELALTDGGLVNDTLRKRVWPKLVGLDYKLDPIDFTTSQGTTGDKIQDDHEKENNQNNQGSKNKIAEQQQSSNKTAVPVSEERTKQSSSSMNGHQTEVTGPNDSTKSGSLPSLAAGDVVLSLDSSQIDRDVARCTWHLLTGSQRSRRWQYQNKQGHGHKSKKIATVLKKKQRRLANLINRTLVTSYDWRPSTTFDGRHTHQKQQQQQQQQLRYYQGYHDVACIFLHALGGAGSSNSISSDDGMGLPMSSSLSSPYNPTASSDVTSVVGDLDLPTRVLCQISFSHFSDALQSNFVQLQTGLKLVLFPLLSKLDVDVHNHLLDADMEPFFCLSWIITWFAHDVRDTDLVKRLFDAFLVSHPLLPVYVSLAMMVHPHNRTIILQTDCDFASLHQCLASLPRHSCQVGWKRRDDGWEGAYISDDEPEDPHDDDEAWQALTPPRPTSQGDTTQGGSGTKSTKDDLTASTDGIDESFDHVSASKQDGHDVANKCPTTPSRGSSRKPLSTRDHDDYDDHVDRNPVPFQELIDMALGFIKKYPPNCLVALAQSYYKDDWSHQLMLLSDNDFNCPSPSEIQRQIGLLRPCPVWSTVPSCTSDWVIKQRLRQLFGLRPTSRKDRRKRTKYGSSPQKPRPRRILPSDETTSTIPEALAMSVTNVKSTDTAQESSLGDQEARSPPSKTEIEAYLRSNTESLAVIAIGYGPEYWTTTLRHRNKVRRRLRTAVVVGTATVVMVGAIAMGISMNQYQQQNDRGNSSMKPLLDDPVISNDRILSGTVPTKNITVLPKVNVLHQTGARIHQASTTTASIARPLKGVGTVQKSPDRPRAVGSTSTSTQQSNTSPKPSSGTAGVSPTTLVESVADGSARGETVEGGRRQTQVRPLRIVRACFTQMIRMVKNVEMFAIRLIHFMYQQVVVTVWQAVQFDVKTVQQHDNKKLD